MHTNRSKLRRRLLAWAVTPIVTAGLAFGGVAFASNNWHTSQKVTAAGKLATLQPIIATATIEEVWPGQPLKVDVHFNNPNPVAVNVAAVQATQATYTLQAAGPNPASTVTVYRYPTGSESPFPVSAAMFDLAGVNSVPAGGSDQTLTGSVLDASFASTLQQGSTISITYWVDEAAY